MNSSILKKITTYFLVFGMALTLVQPQVKINTTYAKPNHTAKPTAKPTTKPTATPTPTTKTPTATPVASTAAPLHTVDTVDSISKGVTINMFNYDSAASIGAGGYDDNDNGVTQGILRNKVESNGFPKIVKGSVGTSLSKWFSESGSEVENSYMGCNNLFINSAYEDTGYFYYSCFDNYAKLNTSKDSATDSYLFSVYDELGTPSNEDYFFYKRGNFMPFNSITQDSHSSNRNLFDMYDNELASNDPNYNKELHIAQPVDFFFGMQMQADFLQLKDGKVNGKDMVFEFLGDDDLWIYVDGVLVLDLGGIHDAKSGKINFATGEIIEDTSDRYNKTKKNVTSIRQRFIDALGATAAAAYFTGDELTFSDYSKHDIQMFYMERGAGASNCYIKFNISTIPKGTVKIEKELSGTEQSDYTNEEFGFKLYVQKEISTDAYSNEYEVYTAKLGDKIIDGGNESELTCDSEGIFYLKAGQIAEFNGIKENRKYYVEEVNIDSAKYDAVSVNETSVEKLFTNSQDTTFDARSTVRDVSNRGLVVFDNNCSDINDLSISKEMSNGMTSDDIFDFNVYIEDKYGEMILYDGKCYVGEDERIITDGKLSIKAGQTAVIKKLVSGTEFAIEEVLTEEMKSEYLEPEYKVTNASETLKTVGATCASGTIMSNTDASVVIKNCYNVKGTLVINKQIDRLDLVDGDAIFNFKIEVLDNDGDVTDIFFRSIRFNNEEVLKKSITITDLRVGSYRVTEIESIRYECESNLTQTDMMTTANNYTASFDFSNKKSNDDYFSDTDVVVNEFRIDENGKLVVTKNKLED